MSRSNLHLAWARLFLRAAAAAGVTDVVLSPGSIDPQSREQA